MKRMLSLLLTLVLTLTLTGCRKPTQIPSVDGETEVPTVETGISLTELNVEFVADGHDADTLMRIKRELPALLLGALAEHDVRVEKVSVTFGTSSEATIEALARAAVQLAFLPTESYLAHTDALIASNVSCAREVIRFDTTTSEYGLALRETVGDWSWDDLAQATWALPRAESSLACRWLAAYLDLAYDRRVDELKNVIRYSELDELDASTFDLYVADRSAPFAAEPSAGALDLPNFFESVAVVSAQDAILSTDAFRTALSEVLTALSADEESALYAYNGTSYAAAGDAELFVDWQFVYDFEHGA